MKKHIPAGCTVAYVDGMTIVVHPQVQHLSKGGDHQDFIGKTQRVETWKGAELLRVEESRFWFRGTGKFFDVEIVEVAA
jgi:hypothetical protein